MVLTPDGLLLVDKPAGVTSHDVVAATRRALRQRRIGHLGTLDPFATGLLVLLLGRATRLARFVDAEPKEYEATIRFGFETDTDDLTGTSTREAPPPTGELARARTAQLTGVLQQVPPAYSAKKVDGERAYRAARDGRPLELAPADVVVHRWDILESAPDMLRARITCGGGTYIRALARDLGRLAASAAHLSSLRRTGVGAFRVTNAIPLADLDAAAERLLSAADALGGMPRQALDLAERAVVVAGGRVPARIPGPRAALVDASNDLVAVAERTGDRWQPRVVVQDA